MIAKLKKQKKLSSKTEDLFFQIIFVFLLVFFVGYLAVSNYRIARKRGELNERIESLTEEIQTLEAERQRLEAGIVETQKDVYWEERVREQGYVKEGEEQVVVLGPEQIEKEEVKAENNFIEELFEKIKEFFEKITP
ncbi:MAG: FtsB family cell division protein [Candidatus Nealsonbacteria bacterium]